MGKHIFKHKNKNEHDFLTFKGKKIQKRHWPEQNFRIFFISE